MNYLQFPGCHKLKKYNISKLTKHKQSLPFMYLTHLLTIQSDSVKDLLLDPCKDVKLFTKKEDF